jgi:hypothetical protein
VIDVAATGRRVVDCKPAVGAQAVDDRADMLFAERAAMPAADDRRRNSIKDEHRPDRREFDRDDREIVKACDNVGGHGYGRKHRERDRRSTEVSARCRASELTGKARQNRRPFMWQGSARPAYALRRRAAARRSDARMWAGAGHSTR